MNTIKYLPIRIRIFSMLLLAVALLISSCEEEDPFVDRTVAPLLMVFDEVTGYLSGGGITSVPSVTKTVTAANYTDPVVLTVTLFELDKSGILDNTVGIDSIPLSGLAIIFSKRDGTTPIEISSDETGKVIISTTWEALGVTDVQTIATSQPAKTITIPLLWSGEYKGQSFARYSQVVFSKAAS